MSANERQVGGSHYKGAPVQHWDFVLMHQIPYMEAQVIKYVMRWRKKNGVEDLRKAAHFIEKLIEWEVQDIETRNALCDKKGFARDDAPVSELEKIMAEAEGYNKSPAHQILEKMQCDDDCGEGPGASYVDPDNEPTCSCKAKYENTTVDIWYCSLHGDVDRDLYETEKLHE